MDAYLKRVTAPSSRLGKALVMTLSTIMSISEEEDMREVVKNL